MPSLPASRSLPVGTIGVMLVVFVLTGITGYVYSHEPARDTLAVELTTAVETPAVYLSGTIVAIDAESLTIVDASGAERTIPFSSATLVEELRQVGTAPGPGVAVNIGVNDTRFGQFVTGIVAIEAAP